MKELPEIEELITIEEINANPEEKIKDLRKNIDAVNWFDISWHKNLSEEFIREFQDKVNWYLISAGHDPLSDDFIREFQDKIDWFEISYNFRGLSEEIIREFQDKLYWPWVSWKQDLSPEFCFEFYDKVSWKTLYRFGKLYKGYFDNAPKHVKLYITLNYRELTKYL